MQLVYSVTAAATFQVFECQNVRAENKIYTSVCGQCMYVADNNINKQQNFYSVPKRYTVSFNVQSKAFHRELACERPFLNRILV
jgi:hypothetical protein